MIHQTTPVEEYAYLCRLLDRGVQLERPECEVMFPNLISHIKNSVDIVSLVQNSGVKLYHVKETR